MAVVSLILTGLLMFAALCPRRIDSNLDVRAVAVSGSS
jgi:hypothetical protein